MFLPTPNFLVENWVIDEYVNGLEREGILVYLPVLLQMISTQEMYTSQMEPNSLIYRREEGRFQCMSIG